jgi:hypothetical protein
MMIEGSGSGSIPLASGSESGFWRPKNTWIRWIRIRNTDILDSVLKFCGKIIVHQLSHMPGIDTDPELAGSGSEIS